eukprot:m.84703 g.84703  ORF g.84703 m.84703 type:complete len:79 (+) comp12977_c0_seq1:1469-1705(+)
MRERKEGKKSFLGVACVKAMLLYVVSHVTTTCFVRNASSMHTRMMILMILKNIRNPDNQILRVSKNATSNSKTISPNH